MRSRRKQKSIIKKTLTANKVAGRKINQEGRYRKEKNGRSKQRRKKRSNKNGKLLLAAKQRK